MSVFVETNPKKSMYIRTKPAWQNFESLKLYHPYSELQSNIIDNLMKQKKTDIENYKTKTKDYPRIVRESDLEKLAYQNTKFLKNSFELWQETMRVTNSIKPILSYYSWQQFFAFFIYTLFKWPMHSGGHGLHCIWDRSDPDEIKGVQIVFRHQGFFRRLVDSFSILGSPSAYGSWIPLGGNKSLIFEENTFTSRISVDTINIHKIIEFTPEKFYQEFNTTYPEKYYGSHVDVLLTDFIIIYISSNIARYRPQLWGDILNGKDKLEAEYYLRFQKACRNFSDEHNCLLDQVWSEFLKLNE